VFGDSPELKRIFGGGKYTKGATVVDGKITPHILRNIGILLRGKRQTFYRAISIYGINSNKR